jgi:hypothetical protein
VSRAAGLQPRIKNKTFENFKGTDPRTGELFELAANAPRREALVGMPGLGVDYFSGFAGQIVLCKSPN